MYLKMSHLLIYVKIMTLEIFILKSNLCKYVTLLSTFYRKKSKVLGSIFLLFSLGSIFFLLSEKLDPELNYTPKFKG